MNHTVEYDRHAYFPFSFTGSFGDWTLSMYRTSDALGRGPLQLFRFSAVVRCCYGNPSKPLPGTPAADDSYSIFFIFFLLFFFSSIRMLSLHTQSPVCGWPDLFPLTIYHSGELCCDRFILKTMNAAYLPPVSLSSLPLFLNTSHGWTESAVLIK